MATPTDPIELLIRNALMLQRLANGITRDSSGILRALFDEIAAELVKIDPTAVTATRYRRDRIAKVIARIEQLAPETFETWRKALRNDLAQVGVHQGRAAVQQLIATLGPVSDRVRAVSPTLNMIKSIIDTNPFRGDTLAGWAKVQEQATIRRLRQQIQLGMTAEESIDQLVRRVRGISDGRGGFSGGVMHVTRREAAALVRTAVTEIANEAALITYRGNPRVTKTYTYVATLDSRTTEICMALDGRVFAYDDPKAKKPPQHWACRSFVVANVDWKALGIDPPEEGTRAARDPITGKTIQVPASQTYGDWLRSAPPEVQNDILGPTRAQLFRAQKLDVRDLVRGDNSIVLVKALKQSNAGPPSPPPAPLTSGGGGGAYPQRDPRLVAALDAAEAVIRPLSYEVAHLFELDGQQVLRRTQYHPSQVDFAPADLQLMPDRVLTHNHPRSSSFSSADVVFAIEQNLDEIRAVGRAFRYRLIRPASGWSPDFARRIINLYRTVDADVLKEFRQLIAAGQMTTAQAELLHHHEVWTRIKAATGIDYRQETW